MANFQYDPFLMGLTSESANVIIRSAKETFCKQVLKGTDSSNQMYSGPATNVCGKIIDTILALAFETPLPKDYQNPTREEVKGSFKGAATKAPFLQEHNIRKFSARFAQAFNNWAVLKDMAMTLWFLRQALGDRTMPMDELEGHALARQEELALDIYVANKEHFNGCVPNGRDCFKDCFLQFTDEVDDRDPWSVETLGQESIAIAFADGVYYLLQTILGWENLLFGPV